MEELGPWLLIHVCMQVLPAGSVLPTTIWNILSYGCGVMPERYREGFGMDWAMDVRMSPEVTFEDCIFV